MHAQTQRERERDGDICIYICTQTHLCVNYSFLLHLIGSVDILFALLRNAKIGLNPILKLIYVPAFTGPPSPSPFHVERYAPPSHDVQKDLGSVGF